ncbi:MAG TPA: hypothetical protein VFS20_19610 [Longimicrobium sp.]|nr:hypothetical protein [Longimicrobium sp.]
MCFLESITRTFRRMVPALGCALALGACTTWIEAPSPAPARRHEFSGPVRITRSDGFSVVLNPAYVTGDTLYGYTGGNRIAVPLQDVRTTHRRELDPLRSIGAAAVGAAAAFGAYVVMVLYAYGYT